MKPSHWSLVHVICMRRESGISHIKFLCEGVGRSIRVGPAEDSLGSGLSSAEMPGVAERPSRHFIACIMNSKR